MFTRRPKFPVRSTIATTTNTASSTPPVGTGWTFSYDTTTAPAVLPSMVYSPPLPVVERAERSDYVPILLRAEEPMLPEFCGFCGAKLWRIEHKFAAFDRYTGGTKDVTVLQCEHFDDHPYDHDGWEIVEE